MPEIIATLKSPAAVGGLPGVSYGKDGLAYIPGSVLRGAVAAAWLDAGRAVDADFISVFEQDVHWGPLHLPGSTPQPTSWLVHKYEAGDRCPRAWDETRSDAPTDGKCPECNEPIERAKGQIQGVKMGSQTHVKLENGTAADGQLFMRRQIAKGQTFKGSVQAATPEAERRLLEALSLVGLGAGTEGTVWLGGRRTSDRGRAALTLGSVDSAPAATPGKTVSVMLISPAIFVDGAGRSSAVPHPDELAEAIGVRASVTRRWVRWTTVGGWHAASRLPKSNERAVAIGSVLEITADSGDLPADALERLMKRGLGLRRAEGYGAVVPVPVPPRSHADLSRLVVPLRVLLTKDALFMKFIEELKRRAAELRSGSPTSPMPMVEMLTNPSPALLRALSIEDGAHIKNAARTILSITDPAELDTILAILGGTR